MSKKRERKLRDSDLSSVPWTATKTRIHARLPLFRPTKKLVRCQITPPYNRSTLEAVEFLFAHRQTGQSLSMILSGHSMPTLRTAQSIFVACILHVQLAVELQSGYGAPKGSRGNLQISSTRLNLHLPFPQLFLMSIVQRGLKAIAAVLVCLQSCKGALAVVLLPEVSQLTGYNFAGLKKSIREEEENQKEATLGVGPVTVYSPGWIHQVFWSVFVMSSMPKRAVLSHPMHRTAYLHIATARGQGVQLVHLSSLMHSGCKNECSQESVLNDHPGSALLCRHKKEAF